MSLGMEVGLGPGNFVLDGDTVPFPQKRAEPPPQFSAHFYYGQTAACIKMSLGMELGLDPGDFVLDGDPVALSPKGGGPAKFSAHVYCDQTAGWMKLILGMVVGRSAGEFVLDGDPAPSPKRGRVPSPILGVEVENFEIGPEVGALPVIANFVALNSR